MMTMTDDGLGIPEELKVENRTPLTPEQEMRLQETSAKAGVRSAIDWDKPKGMPDDEWEKVKIDRAAEKKAKTGKRIADLRASKGLLPNPKGQPQIKRKDQLPIPPRKGATLPTPRAPRPAKPGPAAQDAPKPNNAPTGSAGAASQHQETIVKKTNMKKKSSAKTKTSSKKTPGHAQAAKGAAKAGNGGVRTGSKLELVAGLLKRKEGCTLAEILSGTGWPSCSVPQQANAAGLTLKKEKKKGEPTRYWAA